MRNNRLMPGFYSCILESFTRGKGTHFALVWTRQHGFRLDDDGRSSVGYLVTTEQAWKTRDIEAFGHPEIRSVKNINDISLNGYPSHGNWSSIPAFDSMPTMGK